MTSEKNIDVSKMSDKALTMMGFSTELQVDAFMKSKDGTLELEHWKIFWDVMRHKKGSSAPKILAKLIEGFLASCKDHKDRGITGQRLLNSVLFYSSWHKIRENSELKKLLNEWEKKKSTISSIPHLHQAENVLEFLHLKLGGEDVLPQLISLLLVPRTFDRIQDYRKKGLITLDGEFITGGIGSSVFMLIHSLCNDPGYLNKVLFAVCDHLDGLVMNHAYPEETSYSLCAAVQLIRSFLKSWKIENSALLQRLTNSLSRFYLWPYPFSREANSALEMIKNEIIWPANGLLEMFISDGRVPELYDFPEDKLTPLQKSRPVFYILDTLSESSAEWYSLLQIRDAEMYVDEKLDSQGEHYAQVLNPSMKAMFILSFFEGVISKSDQEQIRNLTVSDINLLFEKTVHVLDECLSMSISKAKKCKAENLEKLKVEYLNLAKSSATAAPTDRPNLPEEFGTDFCLKNGNIAHIAFLESHGYEFPTSTEIKNTGFTSFPKTDIFDKLKSLLNTYSKIANEDDPFEIRIVLGGDDALIHRFVCAYMSIVTESPELLIGAVIRIFVVPIERNGISEYLARYDPWYDLNIYTPFRPQNMILPKPVPESAFMDPPLEVPPSLKLPQVFLRGNIENYIRTAEHLLPIKMYKVEGWFGSKTDNVKKIGKNTVYLPDVVLPLVQYGEIGQIAEGNYQLCKGKGTKSDVFGASISFKSFSINDPKVKDFKFAFYDLTVKYTCMDLEGNLVTNASLLDSIALPFQRISVSNVPNENSSGHPSNPRNGFLELFVKTNEQKARQRVQRSWAISEPLQQVQSIEIGAPRKDSNFRMLIDGVHFGPFQSVRISPFEVDGKHISFPVSTFFPLHQ